MPDDIRERIMEGTYACIARVGLTGTTMEDAARAAGLSRSTVYRYFPGGREELVREAVGWEAQRFFARLATELSGSDDLATLIESALIRGQEAVEGHEVLQKVLHTEPDVFMQQLTVEGTHLLDLVRDFLTPFLAEVALPEDMTPVAVADYVARMILTHITAPGSWDLSDPAQVHELVTTQILGWMGGSGGHSGGSSDVKG